jgi:hypothetical protein
MREGQEAAAADGQNVPERNGGGELGLPYGFRDLHIQFRLLE